MDAKNIINLISVLTFRKLRSWHPVPSLHGIDGETVETVADIIFVGSKITADGDCSHEIKKCLLIRRKVMTNLDSILKKQRHYFANKGSWFFQWSCTDVRVGL